MAQTTPPQYKILQLALPFIIDPLISLFKNLQRIFVATLAHTFKITKNHCKFLESIDLRPLSMRSHLKKERAKSTPYTIRVKV